MTESVVAPSPAHSRVTTRVLVLFLLVAMPACLALYAHAPPAAVAATGPGADDDGVGVATLLETVRALKAGARLRNDVIFLFTDGEEVGMLGARAFVGEHPWAKEVGVALNFEARGNTGPALMFETSNG